MAAKEEAAVLKYLKKNPSQEVLDISFAIDIDEALVAQAIEALAAKSQVEAKDVGGRLQWSLAAPKAAPPVSKPAPAPAAAKPAATPEEDPEDDDVDRVKGGVSKGFVFGIGAATLVLAVAIGWVLGGMQAGAATKALADTEVKLLRDSVGLVKVSLNQRLDNLESQIRELKTPPKAEEPKAEEKKTPAKKAPAKPAKKKRK